MPMTGTFLNDKDFRPFTPFRATLLGRPFRVHCGEGQQGNRITNPSFRRKPESRTLGSRHALFREDFLDSGFRRNDG